MVGLVQADNFFILYTFWELTSITSFLLIGIQHTDARARAAALHALLVTSAGGLAMLGGFVLIRTETGASRLSQLAAGPRPTGAVITVAFVLLLIGAFTKSAQYPFHAWSGRDGGAHTGQRVLAFGDNGHGGGLPGGASRARVRGRDAVAPDRVRGGQRHDPGGRLACAAPA